MMNRSSIVGVLLFLAMLLSSPAQEGENSSADPQAQTVRLRLVTASPAAHAVSFLENEPPPHFLSLETHARLGAYQDVYPGIDAVAYGNEHYFEYAFILAPGAPAERISLALDELNLLNMTSEGHVIYEGLGIDCYQQAPFACRITETGQEDLSIRYSVAGSHGVRISVDDMTPEERDALNNHSMLLVPGGGQPGGPIHDFFMAQYETTHEQFLRFLNDAEAHTDSPRGEHMFFDDKGNIWFNENMSPDEHEMFSIGASRLTYDPTKKRGERYDHVRDSEGRATFARHPVTGVTWYGSLKYCNWLTITSGRGLAECAYREGTNALSWAPVGATNWHEGTFSDLERKLWLPLKGFRLPMLNCDPLAITTNLYNEFYKAAVWSAKTNVSYGFGRNSFLGTDANAIDTINRHSVRTFPVGFFDGENKLDDLTTECNENFFMIFDLSGNVAEWVNDFGRPRSTETRGQCGGSWSERLKAVQAGAIAEPAMATGSGGFRPMTTFMPDNYRIVHVLYCFHYPGGIEDDARDPGEKEVEPEEEVPDTADDDDDDVYDDDDDDVGDDDDDDGPPGFTRPPYEPPYVPPVIPSPPASPFNV